MKKEQPQPAQRNTFLWVSAVLVLLYLATHFFALTRFPVFADEAIYIRWAQLLLDDPKQYLFFAMNDGKTPLFIWMISATQWISKDQLFAARTVGVLAGVFQMFVTAAVLREFGAKKLTQVLGMIFTATLPFWVIYHRMALMDGWLTLWISISFWLSMKLAKKVEKKVFPWQWTRETVVLTSLSGASLGLALWTKLPALFYFPVICWIPVFMLSSGEVKVNSVREKLNYVLPQLGVAAFALVLFVTLRVSPIFGQLFSRGQDFTFTLSEFFSGKWTESFANTARFTGYFITYLTWPVILAVLAGLFSNRARKTTMLLLFSGFIFLAPFILLGKVVHPRYLLPGALFFTVSAAVSIEAVYLFALKRKSVAFRFGISVILALLMGQTLTSASMFFAALTLQPNGTPFVRPDRAQYLEEWSSGHGVYETVQFIREEMKSKTVAVATEGRFGSLPDGLLLYFHGQNVENLYIEGTGQYPVKSLPEFFTARAKKFDRSLLVVNSHRMDLSIDGKYKVAEYCRPIGAPCLQVWDVTHLVK